MQAAYCYVSAFTFCPAPSLLLGSFGIKRILEAMPASAHKHLCHMAYESAMQHLSDMAL